MLENRLEEQEELKQMIKYSVGVEPRLMLQADNEGNFPFFYAAEDSPLKADLFEASNMSSKLKASLMEYTHPKAVTVHVVGFGESGKSELINRLTNAVEGNEHFKNTEQRTMGAELTSHTFTMEDESESALSSDEDQSFNELPVRIWEYGGQKEFRATMGFGFSSSTTSLVVLVLSFTHINICSNVEYWLSLIESTLGESMTDTEVAIVCSHADKFEDQEQLEETLEAIKEAIEPWARTDEVNHNKRFSVFGELFYGDLTTADGASAVESHIKRRVLALRNDGANRVPRFCEKVATELKKLEDTEIVTCLPEGEMVLSVQAGLVGELGDIPSDFIYDAVNYLVRGLEVLKFVVKGETWLFLNPGKLMNKLLGFILASPNTLKKNGISTPQQNRAWNVQERMRRSGCIYASQDEMNSFFPNSIFFKTGKGKGIDPKDIFDLKVAVLEAMDLCTRVDAEGGPSL
jgi:GTPase SAR1 family protein